MKIMCMNITIKNSMKFNPTFEQFHFSASKKNSIFKHIQKILFFCLKLLEKEIFFSFKHANYSCVPKKKNYSFFSLLFPKFLF